jgi:prepilin-type processing-associated H-X9-DG protein
VCNDQNWGINSNWANQNANSGVGCTPVPANAGKSYAWVFNSAHPGGAQFVFCDGSVQFLSQTLDYLTLCRLAFIHDGQPVQVN